MQTSTKGQQQSQNRRQQYRVSGRRDKLQAYIVSGDREVPIRLLDTSFGGAGFVPTVGLNIKPGDTVTLRFMAPEMALPASVRSVIKDRAPLGTDIRYGAEFVDPGSLHRRLPSRLLGLFNRRKAFRVTPDSSKPIQARIRRMEGDVVLGLPIICLSVAGCAMMAKRKEDQMLMAGDAVELSFAIPETDNVVVFVGNVRYGTKQRGGTRYGIEFDRFKSPVFSQQQKALSRYVMTQQRKILDAGR